MLHVAGLCCCGAVAVACRTVLDANRDCAFCPHPPVFAHPSPRKRCLTTPGNSALATADVFASLRDALESLLAFKYTVPSDVLLHLSSSKDERDAGACGVQPTL